MKGQCMMKNECGHRIEARRPGPLIGPEWHKKKQNNQMPRHLISDAHEWINEIPVTWSRKDSRKDSLKVRKD